MVKLFTQSLDNKREISKYQEQQIIHELRSHLIAKEIFHRKEKKKIEKSFNSVYDDIYDKMCLLTTEEYKRLYEILLALTEKYQEICEQIYFLRKLIIARDLTAEDLLAYSYQNYTWLQTSIDGFKHKLSVLKDVLSYPTYAEELYQVAHTPL